MKLRPTRSASLLQFQPIKSVCPSVYHICAANKMWKKDTGLIDLIQDLPKEHYKRDTSFSSVLVRPVNQDFSLGKLLYVGQC